MVGRASAEFLYGARTSYGRISWDGVADDLVEESGEPSLPWSDSIESASDS